MPCGSKKAAAGQDTQRRLSDSIPAALFRLAPKLFPGAEGAKPADDAAPDGRAQLTWLAPGDDGSTGKATKYEVYRHTSVFSEATLGAVTPVSGAPAPQAAGALQTMTVTALHGETTYFWAVRAIDEAGNVGPLSAVVSGKTNNVPPAAVRTLAGKATGNATIDLSWTATGDDGLEGVAASYEIRYLPGPISAQAATSKREL